jgi:hypothetical protein
MRDPHEDLLAEFVSLTLAVFVVAGFIFLTGCSPKLVDISVPEKPAQSCPKLIMPPVGTDCLLDIQGDKVTANDCGDTLLRGYVRARTLLKPDAP